MDRSGFKIRMVIAGSIIFAFYLALASFALGAGVGLPVVLLASLLFVGIQYKLGTWLALRSVGAEDLSKADHPEIHEMVEALSAEMDIPKPDLKVAPMGVPNAFAVGRRQAGTVVIGAELIEILDRDELEGVLAHELSHIDNRDVIIMVVGQSIAAMVGLVVHFLTIVAARRSLIGYLIGIVLGTIAQMLVMVFVLAISRYREYIADADAVAVTEKPRALASALAKITAVGHAEDVPEVNESVSALCIFGGERGLLGAIFATHPPVERRIGRIAPGYDPTPEEIAAELEAELLDECPECGEPVAADWAYCEECGADLDAIAPAEPVEAACPDCGADVEADWQYCQECGEALA